MNFGGYVEGTGLSIFTLVLGPPPVSAGQRRSSAALLPLALHSAAAHGTSLLWEVPQHKGMLKIKVREPQAQYF